MSTDTKRATAILAVPAALVLGVLATALFLFEGHGSTMHVANAAIDDYVAIGDTVQRVDSGPSDNAGILRSALDTINSLDATVGAESRTSVDIGTGAVSTLTIDASTGSLDGYENSAFPVVFKTTSSNVTITGAASDHAASGFSGSVNIGDQLALTGAMTADHAPSNSVGGSGGPGGLAPQIDGKGSASSSSSVPGLLPDATGATGVANASSIPRESSVDSPEPVPEPGSLLLFGSALAALWLLMRGRRRLMV